MLMNTNITQTMNGKLPINVNTRNNMATINVMKLALDNVLLVVNLLLTLIKTIMNVISNINIPNQPVVLVLAYLKTSTSPVKFDTFAYVILYAFPLPNTALIIVKAMTIIRMLVIPILNHSGKPRAVMMFVKILRGRVILLSTSFIIARPPLNNA